MTSWLTTYNPFEAMDNFEKTFFNDPFFSGNDNQALAFGTDITDEGNAYQLTADLPGFNKDDIHVNVDKNVVTVTAERHSEAEDKDKKDKFIRKERSYGSYKRSFNIGRDIDKSGIKAAYDNGVLTLTLPKKEEPEQKTFDIVVE